MSKGSGLGDRLFVDGYDISGDIGAISNVGAPFSPLVMTDITQSAPERKAGKGDGTMTFQSWMNPDTARGFDVLSTLPTSKRYMSYFRGAAIGQPAASMYALQIGYDPNRGDDGSLAISTAAMAAAGQPLDWGRQLTAGKRTDTTATNGASHDNAAASTLGLVAYLHVFGITGTSVTVKLQQSSDNGVGDAWADVVGGGFVAAAAIGAQRIETATNLAVERYLRVVTTGTFTSAIFAVNVRRRRTLEVAS